MIATTEKTETPQETANNAESSVNNLERKAEVLASTRTLVKLCIANELEESDAFDDPREMIAGITGVCTLTIVDAWAAGLVAINGCTQAEATGFAEIAGDRLSNVIGETVLEVCEQLGLNKPADEAGEEVAQ